MGDWIDILEDKAGVETGTYEDAFHAESPYIRALLVGIGTVGAVAMLVFGVNYYKEMKED